jgi:hypothetical protein
MSANDLSFLLEQLVRPQQAEQPGGRIPSTDAVAELPRETRKEASRIAKFYYEQYRQAMSMRRPHALNWIKVLSILSGIHYFKISEGGQWIPLKKRDPRQIRAFVPVLKPMMRWEHGRLSANQIGVTATPLTGRGAESFYDSQLAQDTLTGWLHEINVQAIDDLCNQYLTTYGGYALHVERSLFDRQAQLRVFPFCDLFPIPFDARTWDEMEGIGRVTTVSEGWLQTQDELYRKRHGKEPERPMAKVARGMSTMPTWNYSGFGSNLSWGSSFRGATAIWIWRKPGELTNGLGEHGFMLDDELHGFASYETPKHLPLYPVYYIKEPHDWWPSGFAEQIVPMQREINRQVTVALESGVINRGIVGFNSELIDANAIQDSVTGLVPFKQPGPEDKIPPLVKVDASPVGREIGGLIALMQDFARSAVGYDSGIIFGQQEGRTEGGPATSMLHTNAQAPLVPVLERKQSAYGRAYYDALDVIREVWPEEKKVKLIGPDNLARERLIARNKLPTSDNVLLTPLPMLPNGRMGMFQMLLALRNQPVEAGEQRIVQVHELRRCLHTLGLAPPGLDLFDKRERRIAWRIAQLINDGQQPAIAPAGQRSDDMQGAEAHDLAVKMLQEVVLDPAFNLYAPPVRKALLAEMQFHVGRLPGVAASGALRVDAFDDDDLRMDARQAENALEAMENDPNSLAGQFSPGGIPIGM